MLKMEVKTKPAEEVESVVAVTCDLCGWTDKGADESAYNGVEWTRNGEGGKRESYAVHETTVMFCEGTAYPEGEDLIRRTYHVCPTCFKTRLVPWLETQGAKATEDRTDAM